MSDNRPNILWLCTDQQRFDTLGCYGNPYVRTPHLDKLAAVFSDRTLPAHLPHTAKRAGHPRR